MEALKFLWVMEDLDICLLRPDTFPLGTIEFIIVVVMVEMDLGIKTTAIIPLSSVEFIILVTMVDLDIGLKRPVTLPLAIVITTEKWIKYKNNKRKKSKGGDILRLFKK